MQNWAKRGLQTALVTGGLLMLGTGIASAEENVNPDKPASPLDVSLTVPVKVGNNAVGTPFGQKNLPEIDKTISTKPITDKLKGAAAKLNGAKLPGAERVQKATEKATKAAEAVQQKASDAAPAEAKKAASEAKKATGSKAAAEGEVFRGNRGSLDIVVPIQIANNAIALLGDAEVTGGDSQQSYEGGEGVVTNGSGGALAGNVVDVDYVLPIQIANNAGGIGGNATSTGNSATQDVKTGGDSATDGSGGALSGNIIAPQGATPIQINNNAAVLGGIGKTSDNTSEVKAHSGGSLLSNGADGVLAGNVAGVPVALPVEVNNSALSGLGIADSTGNANTAEAQGGDTRHGSRTMKTYAETNGDGGVASGTLIQPQVASDANVNGLAGALGGISAAGVGEARSTTSNSSTTSSQAGGYSNTSAVGGVLSGTVADAPVAFPVEAYCAAAGAIGKAAADCENETTANAGRETFTDGTDSVLGGNTATAPLGGTIEAFGLSASAVGTADSTATEDKEIKAGGYNGSRGDGSTGGGNIIQTPVATPIEVFGGAASLAGNSTAEAEETKTVSSGGDGNTEDDDAVLASNVVATPIAQPLQAFGIGAAGIGQAHGQATAETDTTAGGDYTGSGKGAVGSGNIVQVASSAPAQLFGLSAAGGGISTGAADNTSSSAAGGTNTTSGAEGVASGNVGAVTNSLPAQVHGLAGALVGDADAMSMNVTDSMAGGDTTADGTGSSLGGNVVNAPIGGAAGVFGSAASVIGFADGGSVNDVVSGSGGNVDTSGAGGSLAGNALSAQALPVAEVFGTAATVGGFATGAGENTTDVVSGGDIATSGTEGHLSGNIFDVPAAAIAEVFGSAVAVGGEAVGAGDNVTVGSVGGTIDTDAIGHQLPVGVLVQVYNFGADLLGQATGVATNVTDVEVGDNGTLHQLVLDGSELPATELPSLNGLPIPAAAQQRSDVPDVTQVLPKITDITELPEVTQLPEVTELPDADALPVQVGLPEVAAPLPAPAVPAMPKAEPVAAKQTGLRGLWAKLSGALSGQNMTIQG